MKLKIGFSRPTGKTLPIFSWLIRLAEWTPYSHVYIQWYNKYTDTTVTYEAGGHSVHFVGQTIFNKRAHTVHEYEIEITKEQHKSLMTYCFRNAGIKYGMLQILGIGYSKFMGLFGKKVKNPFTDGKRSMVCSELAGNVLSDILLKEHNLDLDVAGPRAIYEFMEQLEKNGEVTQTK